MLKWLMHTKKYSNPGMDGGHITYNDQIYYLNKSVPFAPTSDANTFKVAAMSVIHPSINEFDPSIHQ